MTFFASKVSAPEHFLLYAELCLIMNDLQMTIFNYLNRREKHHLSIQRIQNDKCRFAYLKTSSSIISKRFNYFNMYCWAFTIAYISQPQKMLPVTDFQFSMPVVLQRHFYTFKYRLFQTLTGKKERTWTASNDFSPLS